MRAQSPCYGCTERHSECHSSCERYAEFRRNLESEKAVIAKQKEENEKTWDVVMKGLIWENKGFHRSTGRYRTRRD